MSTVAPLRTTHVQPGGGRTLGAVAAEWTKLWSVRSTAWSLVAAAALVVSGGLVLGMSAAASAEAGHDVQSAPHLAAVGLQLALLALVAMTTLSVTSEYSSGTISTTLQGVPLRGRVLAAKAAVVGAVTFVAGVVLSAVGTVSVVSTMGEAGDVDGREVVLSVLGAGAYVALLSLLTLGLGLALRSAAGTITSVLLLLLAIPQIMLLVGVDWLQRAADYLPSAAGQILMTQASTPYGAGVAVLVLVGWAVAAAGAGYAVLRTRDA